MRIYFTGMIPLLSVMLCSCCGLESGTDVPPPFGGEEWTAHVKKAYPDWQPPQEMPEGSAAYEAALNARRKQDAADAVAVSKTEVQTAQELPASETKPAVPAETGSKPLSHIVKEGDTLWNIARNYYGRGDKWTVVFEANKEKIKDPDKIMPGLELQIPPAGKE